MVRPRAFTNHHNRANRHSGFGTWTDGPVAVSYLASLLGKPLRDFAFGGCCGGASFGATLDNAYTPSPALYKNQSVPSVKDQIYSNYTHSMSNVGHALHVITAGQNDLTKHTDAFWEGDPQNAAFAKTLAANLTTYAEYLIGKGAPAVLVANIHPKQLAPVTTKYLCGTNTDCVTTWGNVIQKANSALATALAASPHAGKIIYYDMYSFMANILANAPSYGFTAPLTAFCDGDGDANWNACIAGSPIWEGAEAYFWMNYEQPTTHVHRLMAADMKTTIDRFFS
jgi:phospholipase/lecithinase/hemolysin